MIFKKVDLLILVLILFVTLTIIPNSQITEAATSISFIKYQELPGIEFGALGDIDNDNDLDLLISKEHPLSSDPEVWSNDGNGWFTKIPPVTTYQYVNDVALGDLDGDGDLDAYLARSCTNYVMLNDGTGNLSFSEESNVCNDSGRVFLGDLDKDNDLDVFVLNRGGYPSRIWLNDGAAHFEINQILPVYLGDDVALGDLNGDDYIDAFVVTKNIHAPENSVWINNGFPTYTFVKDEDNQFGSSSSNGVALGDLDRDGDLDAFVANYYCQENEIWENDGDGLFTKIQGLGSSNTHSLALGDLDGDGDLDALVANRNDFNCPDGTSGDPRDKIWLNNGTGTFSYSGQYLSNRKTHDILLGDLDGDGDLDAAVLWIGTEPSEIWLNETPQNQPPNADPNGPYLGEVYSPIIYDGTGSSDPNDDPLTYKWDFGDTYPSTGATPAHSYEQTGIYEVCLTVNDGLVDSVTECTFAVVYDPDGGFVTGGGWIESPADAYKPDLTLTGKANFGFVSKYKKGATVPTGNTEFQFKAGDLNFHSSTYEWLVVTGSDYARYKGTGTINGEGEYKFMIWAGDGQLDTFRIKIWMEDEFENETVIYDNNMDQPIGGGNIVVHTK